MKHYKILLLLLLVAGTVFVAYQQHNAPYRKAQGRIFGTVYSITYQHTDDLHKDILKALQEVDSSLSMFNKESTISKINRNEAATLDKPFLYLFSKAMDISEATDGAFDITVAPLVNAWGFGFKEQKWPDEHTVDSLLAFVGYKKVALKANKIEKQDPRTMIDMSAIAKGYGADAVAQILDNAKAENYMVEIGGEVVVKGKNDKGGLWRIGVVNPNDTTGNTNQYTCVLQLDNCATATSGNYRNFYYKDGKKYAHTIDPRTGHPVQHDIISATIIAPRCYEADAYATAFMVMGLDKAKEVLGKQKHLEAYLVYLTGEGEQTATWMTGGFEKHLLK